MFIRNITQLMAMVSQKQFVWTINNYFLFVLRIIFNDLYYCDIILKSI